MIVEVLLPSGYYTLNYSSISCSRTGKRTLNLLAGYPVEVSPLCPSEMSNSICNGGLYVYYLEGNCPASGKFFKSGNVTIVK